MPGKHNAGGCMCCPTTGCPDCDMWEKISIGAISIPCTECDHSGDYTWRTVGDPVYCGMYRFWNRDGGGGPGGVCTDFGYRIGTSIIVAGISSDMAMVLSYSGADYKITFQLRVLYELSTSPFTRHYHSSFFSKTASTCDGLLGSLTLESSSGGADLCDIDSRTVDLS